MLYSLIRSILFKFPPEEAHYFSMKMLRQLRRTGALNTLGNPFAADVTGLKKSLFGLDFPNPVGLGAGFDKNASWLEELAMLGFGFIEIGTVTPKAQPGNEQPRLFRLPQDKALINRMGFNNDGVEAARKNLAAYRDSSKSGKRPVIGGNIGKNKVTENADAWKDYNLCFEVLFNEVDYFVVNVSSPNTPGLRALQEKDALVKILSGLQHLNQGKTAPKPILLKIAPDLAQGQLDDIVALSFETRLSGLVAANTTISRGDLVTDPSKVSAIGAGGLSGRPLKSRATEVVRYLSEQTGGKIPIIASGGIFTGEDAQEKMDAGASLVQVWTGFIYEGPLIVKKICAHLAAQK